MKAVSLLFLVTLLCFTKDVRSLEITCSDLRKVTVIGSIFISFSNTETKDIPVKFYLSTPSHRDSIEITANDWSGLEIGQFDPSKKTYLVIHGYKSGGQKSWTLLMKDKLLDATNANIILIDWSEGSNKKNYVNAAKNSQLATHRIFNFLQQMRHHVDLLKKTSNKIQWNRLNFIGHSLGAQVSGQTANMLKEDNFWKIERITGLDPAKPCFVNIDSSLRLDRNDADFVDIIHTQTGTGGSTDGLGLKESIGHMDFYINGGVAQPGCVGSAITPKWETMICSHKLAYAYYTESIIQLLMGDQCTFNSYPWDGTYEDAQQVLANKLNNISCPDCPELGLNALKSNRRGLFFVITSTKEPYCKFGDDDVKNVIKVIKRLKGKAPVSTDGSSTDDISSDDGSNNDYSDIPVELYNSSQTLKFENLTFLYLLTFVIFILRN